LLGLLLSDVLHIDPKLKLTDIVGFVLGFPATLVAKILGQGDTLPTLPTLPTSANDAALAAVGDDDELKTWLGILGGTTQAVWGLADIVGDLQTLAGEDGKRGTQSGIVDIFDALCPIAESALLFPYPPYSDKQKQYMWMVPAIVLTSVLPSAMILLGQWDWPELTTALTENGGMDESIANAMGEYVSPFVQAFCGAANTAFGIAYQVKTGDKVWVDIAGTALGNLSFLLAVLGTLWLNETTEDVPVLVKMVVDAIGNVGAAICIYESTSLPPK
jgi:hypothetical protein